MDWHTIILTLFLSFSGGVISGLICVVTMKTDLKWIMKILDQHNMRMNNHSARLTNLEVTNVKT